MSEKSDFEGVFLFLCFSLWYKLFALWSNTLTRDTRKDEDDNEKEEEDNTGHFHLFVFKAEVETKSELLMVQIYWYTVFRIHLRCGF